MAANLESLVSRLEAVTTRLEGVAGGSPGAAATGAPAVPAAQSPVVLAYDEIVNGPFRQFTAASEKIGGDVKTIVADVSRAFAAQRSFLVVASKAKQPTDQGALQKALQPTSQYITNVQNLREGKRSSPHFNHLSALSESISALAWVTVSPAPAPFIKEMSDASQFYTNRVLKEFKDKDKTHVDWVKMWIETMNQLQAYVKQHHTTGLSWNPKGVDIATAMVSAAGGSTSPPAPPPPGGAPPPPPPPPVEAPTASTGSGDDSAGRSALFADLNKGTEISKGLKKVTDDMKTHKNPQLRSGPQPFKAASHKAPTPFKAPASAAAKPTAPAKPAKCELQGKKWIVEYQQDNRNLVISQTDMKHTVYVFRCTGSTVQVKGKVNSIILDSCKKTGVVCDSVVSSIEFVNCQSVQGQALGQVPTVSIDKTDGCQVYLSKESAAANIVTAKSSEMNILIPDSGGEFKEYAIPEQFVTRFDGKKLVTGVTDSLG